MSTPSKPAYLSLLPDRCASFKVESSVGEADRVTFECLASDELIEQILKSCVNAPIGESRYEYRFKCPMTGRLFRFVEEIPNNKQ